VPVDFRDTVRAPGIERRRLALRRLGDLAEHLARAGLVEARLRRGFLHGLEHPSDAKRRELAGEDRLVPRRLHEALGGEIVDLVRLTRAHRVGERGLIQQVGGDELHAIDEVGDPLVRRGRAAPDDTDDAIPFLEEEFGEVGAVLSRDPCDEGGGH
jgi:hypothetical protein